MLENDWQDNSLQQKQSMDFFNDIKGAMDDLDDIGPASNIQYDELTTVAPPAKMDSEDIRAIRSIAESIEGLFDEPKVVESQPRASGKKQVLQEETKIYTPPKISSVQFTILEQNALGTNSLKEYSVVIKETHQVIVDKIMMRECAYVICDYLNKGKSLGDVKILGILGNSMQYASILSEVHNISKLRQNVLRESRYEEAVVFDEQLKTLKTEAHTVKTKVLKFLKEQGYL